MLIVFRLTVSADVNFLGQFGDLDFKPFLDLVGDLGVFFVSDKRDGETLGAKSTSARNSVEIGVRVLWHVIVEDDVDTFNIHSTAKQVRRYKNAPLEVLEQLISLEALFLVHRTVNVYGGEILLFQQRRQRNATLDRLHEDHNLRMERIIKRRGRYIIQGAG